MFCSSKLREENMREHPTQYLLPGRDRATTPTAIISEPDRDHSREDSNPNPTTLLLYPQGASMTSLQRLVRAPSGRSTVLQRLALQRGPSATIRASAAFHTTVSPQISTFTRSGGRPLKRTSNQHGIAKRIMALRAMATTAPSPIHEPTKTEPSTPAPEIKATIPWTGIMSSQAVPPEAAEILHRKVNENLVEIKPDGIAYLPEIWYRSILFEAFGPGGWVMIPVGAPTVGTKFVTREWALFVNGK